MSTEAAAAVTPEGFDQALREVLEGEISVWPARAWYPSSLGHPCDRALVWRFTRWEEQARHDATLQSIFDHGRDHQPLAYRRLEQIGFDVVHESDRPRQYRPRGPKGPVISGRPDGRLIGFRKVKYQPPYSLEIKSMSGYAWDQVTSAVDLQKASSHWTRGYYAQGQLYAFLEDLPHGVFVLMSKATGLLKLLPFPLDYEFVEGLLKRIEGLQPVVEQGVDPDPIPFDAGVCGGCGFRKICYPPRSFGEGASVIDDDQLIEQLEHRERLAPASKEYADVDKAIKDRLKHDGIKFALVGPFVVTGSLVEKNIKAVEAHTRSETHFKIERALAPIPPAEIPF